MQKENVIVTLIIAVVSTVIGGIALEWWSKSKPIVLPDDFLDSASVGSPLATFEKKLGTCDFANTQVVQLENGHSVKKYDYTWYFKNATLQISLYDNEPGITELIIVVNNGYSFRTTSQSPFKLGEMTIEVLKNIVGSTNFIDNVSFLEDPNDPNKCFLIYNEQFPDYNFQLTSDYFSCSMINEISETAAHDASIHFNEVSIIKK